MQGGDPRTGEGPRESRGAVVRRACRDQRGRDALKACGVDGRGAGIDSAGPQFFAVAGDAPCLDGQCTVLGAVTEGRGAADMPAAAGLEGGRLPEQPADPEETGMLAAAAP